MLGDGAAPVAVLIDAARRLISVPETADAHPGLLRPAVGPEPDAGERARILLLLPADLRRFADPGAGPGADRPAP
ncbi:hypothetical protein ACFC5Z_04860 [Streptomyces sp. NPDC056004]|uniref:hypothetical protein n=1 Tax=Streptomyces sp. NPDC056004 TaxID=3345677 RepID=UPI0035DCCD9A